MEIGTGFAVVAFADQCLKYGRKFVRRCQSYLHAEDEATELLIAIESNWVKIEAQIEILQKIAGSLDKRLQDIQSQVLSQLEGKLKTATLIINQLESEKKDKKLKEKLKHDERDLATRMRSLGGMPASKRLKYVSKKESLYKIVEEIEKWQARYDPTWILIMQMSIGEIDNRLEEQEKNPETGQIPIITAAKGIRDAARAIQEGTTENRQGVWIEKIHLNSSAIARSSVLFSDLAGTAVLIDKMAVNQAANVKKTIKEVRNLARILAEVDPTTFGLLKCRGVIKTENAQEPVSFKFVLDIPPGLSNPQSLRTVLLSGKSYPLDERLSLAKKIASSVLFVHTVQFVHKNLRPETIIIFQNAQSNIGSPFLAGFEQFRLEDGNTYRAGDDVWEHNLYRHPSRQGTHPEVDYQMQHDIYSLGVVLLEIGLWTSFVLYDIEELSFPDTILNLDNPKFQRKPERSASQNKTKLEDLAASELPNRLGTRYTDVVLSCLRCLDLDSAGMRQGFGTDDMDLEDEDGIVIGVRYIENVLERIQEIVL